MIALDALFLAWAAAIGLALGSFWNVAIARWPRDESVLPGSHCPACRRAIGWRDLMPVASWVLLRGRCRHCGAAIGPEHPVVEALGGLLGVLAFRRTVPDVLDAGPVDFLAFGAVMLFLSALVISALVDVRHQIIPEQTSTYAVPVLLGLVAALDRLGWHGWPPMDLRQAVFGAAGSGLFLGAIYLGSAWVLGREGLGRGDLWLMAAIGAFVGALPGALLVLLLASVGGSVVGLVTLVATGRRTNPFGPALAVAAGVWVLYGDLVVREFFPIYSGLLER